MILKAKLELAGGKFDKVEMREIEPGNVTMVATENIAKGERIGYFPLSMQITEEMVSNGEYLKKLKAHPNGFIGT